MKTRFFIVSFFVFVNVMAFFVYVSGYQNSSPINNMDEIPFYYYFLNLILLLLSLFIILKIFTFLEKNIQVRSLKTNLLSEKNNNAFGIFLILAQLVYLYVFITQGGAVAGQKDNLGGGIYGMFTALLQLQNVSLLYIASFRRNKLWKFLLALYIVSNVLQGWTGFILILIVLYLFDQENKNKITSYFKVSLIGLGAIIFFYPIIYFFRLAIRIMGSNDVSFKELNLLSSLGNGNWVDFSFYTYNKLIERFEEFYLSLGSLIYHNEIAYAYKEGLITPYYLEGFALKLMGKFSNTENYVSLGNFLPSVFYEDYIIGKDYWNISPGFNALFYTDSFSILFVLPYYGFLIFIMVLLLKFIKAPKLSFHLIYYWLIIYLFVGWYSQFFYLIWSVIVFFFLFQFFGFIKIILLNKRNI